MSKRRWDYAGCPSGAGAEAAPVGEPADERALGSHPPVVSRPVREMAGRSAAACRLICPSRVAAMSSASSAARTPAGTARASTKSGCPAGTADGGAALSSSACSSRSAARQAAQISSEPGRTRTAGPAVVPASRPVNTSACKIGGKTGIGRQQRPNRAASFRRQQPDQSQQPRITLGASQMQDHVQDPVAGGVRAGRVQQPGTQLINEDHSVRPFGTDGAALNTEWRWAPPAAEMLIPAG